MQKKKSTFAGKGYLNCQISQNIFEYLTQNNIPTHYLSNLSPKSFIAQKIDIIPIEFVLRNIAYGSLCKETNLKAGTVFEKPLIDLGLKDLYKLVTLF